MIPIISCVLCAHLFRDGQPGQRCKAFPQGIPAEIIHGENDHKSPFPGDNGILFEEIDRDQLPSSGRQPDWMLWPGQV